MSLWKPLHHPLCFLCSWRKASLPAVQPADHKKQSPHIFHYLCERTRRSPVERNKMAACAQSARWRCQISAVCARSEGVTPVLCWVGAYDWSSDVCSSDLKWKKLSVSANNCFSLFFFFFLRPAHVSDPGYDSARLGTPNVQIYLTNFEIPCHRWPFTGKGIISMFFFFLFLYVWIRLTFARISQIAFDMKAKGTSAGTFFHCCRESENNNQEGTLRLFNVQIRGAVTCLWQTFNAHCRDIIITMFP